MDKVTYINNLSLDRWKEYKDLSIYSVKNEPLAFSETYDEIIKKEDKEWKEELQGALDGSSILLLAEQDGKLVGMYLASFHKKEKLKHNAFLSSLFVFKEFRGKGIGTILLEKILEMILQRPNIKNIHCEILESQIPSLELHKKFGFEITGEIKNFLCVDGKYFNEYWLEKRIR